MHLDVSTSHSSVSFPLVMSSRTLYTHPHHTDARTSHVTTSWQMAITPRSERICYYTSNYIIYSISTTTVPICEPGSPRCLTGNTVSSTSEIQQLASYVACLVTSLSAGPIRVLPSRTETFSSSLSRLIGWYPYENCRSGIKLPMTCKIEVLSLLSWCLTNDLRTQSDILCEGGVYWWFRISLNRCWH